MQCITSGNALIHFDFEAAGPAKPTLVFVNSLGTDFRIWDRLRALLRGHCNMLFHDKRGHGLSTLGTEPHRIETYAADLARLMDYLGLQSGVAIGLSVGGLIVQALYHARPDLVQKLVISNSGVKLGTTDSWNTRIATVEAQGIESIADAVMKLWFTPAFHSSHAADVTLARTMLARTNKAGYIACCEALRDADFSAAAAHIKVPSLFIAGDADGSTPPALVEAASRLVPSAQYQLIADCAHIPCLQQPAHHAGLIRQFAGF